MKTCKICGADISERKGNAKYCPKCSKEKALERNRHYKNRQKKLLSAVRKGYYPTVKILETMSGM